MARKGVRCEEDRMKRTFALWMLASLLVLPGVAGAQSDGSDQVADPDTTEAVPAAWKSTSGAKSRMIIERSACATSASTYLPGQSALGSLERSSPSTSWPAAAANRPILPPTNPRLPVIRIFMAVSVVRHHLDEIFATIYEWQERHHSRAQ